MSELKDTKKQAYTRKVLDKPIEKANAKCIRCKYQSGCPYEDRSDCFEFNS